MLKNSHLYFLLTLVLFALVFVSSCRKDSEVAQPNTEISGVKSDSSQISSRTNAVQYLLASSGKLQLKVNNTTYTFDAVRDSIVFIYVHPDDSSAYFGITAINKEHTLSFGISSPGILQTKVATKIGGTQLLVKSSENKPITEYALSARNSIKDPGNIKLEHFNQLNGPTNGTFATLLTVSGKSPTLAYKVDGKFDLLFK